MQCGARTFQFNHLVEYLLGIQPDFFQCDQGNQQGQRRRGDAKHQGEDKRLPVGSLCLLLGLEVGAMI